MSESVSKGADSAQGLDALGAITDAVEAGAGLPEILRAAARALDASLILIDRSATVLAVTARSPAGGRSVPTSPLAAPSSWCGPPRATRPRTTGAGGCSR